MLLNIYFKWLPVNFNSIKAFLNFFRSFLYFLFGSVYSTKNCSCDARVVVVVFFLLINVHIINIILSYTYRVLSMLLFLLEGVF